MSSNNIPTQLPKLTSENWDRWNIQMQAIFGFPEVLEVIQNGYAVVGDEGTEAQRTLYRANKKKDCKAIYLIHQSVDEVNFDKISACTTAKQAWDTLERCHTGGMKVKKVKLQALRKQYEHTEMEDDEKIEDFFNKVKVITNSMTLNGETISDEQFCEKILRSLPSRFDFIVCTIEETKDLSTMTPAELLSTLQARELRFSERNGDKKSDQALYASSKKSHGGGKKQWAKNKGKENQDHHKTQSNDKTESSSKGGGGGSNYKHGGQKFNKKNIKCYNCDKVGHFANECWFAKDHKGKGKKKHDSDACAAQEESSSDSDENEVKLMMVTLSEVSDDHSHTDYWFLDTGCSNHMTSHKEWLIDINPSKKSKVRFADDRTLHAEGMGKMVITRDDGKNVIMEDVLYVPGMKSNLLSIGQLIQKGFEVKMKNNSLSLFDTNHKLILKTPLTKNMTFQINMSTAKLMCLGAIETEDRNWIWHARFGHLNFKSLRELGTNHMVNGLPIIKVPEKVCKVCMIGKQTRKSFKLEIPSRARNQLEVVHSDVCGPFEVATLAGNSFLWGEAASTAVYILNKCPTKKLVNIVPEEKWNGKKPMVSHLKVFGALCYSHIPDQKRTKLQDKSKQMILVGYHPTGAYRLYDPLNKKVKLGRDIVVCEAESWDWKVQNPVINPLLLDEEHSVEDTRPATEASSSRASEIITDGTRRNIMPSTRLQDFETYNDNAINIDGDLVHFALFVDSEPVSFEEAISSDVWKKAMKEEIEAIEKNNTWFLTDLPTNKHQIAVRWVYKLSYFLGLQLDETTQGILLHQKKYVKELLLKFNMLGCNPAATPIEVNPRLELDDTGENVNSTLYRQMVGSLRYLCNSRPDLSFAVGAVSRFVESPKQSHMVAVKRILRYVQGTMEFGVLFPNNISNSVNRLEGFSDSDWCGDHVDRRSTTGYIFKFLHAPISWCSKKQPVIALSSCEAEYIACDFAACQGIWLESLLKDIQVELTEPIQLLVDNKSAINLAKNPISHGRSKHIETRFHFIREQVNNGRIVLNHCPTEVQEADILTKGLKHDRFIKLRSKIGVTTLENTLN
ncbi:hypothetical protein TSUD_409690 [Trifolium subterraneum]|uniref:CCHC-type domain-containing protein n=1 Tax=Trifolium subterraneum TaxID=3900 RepID=A0A2Z6P714_TRISU|nr:hypothetical protein TSUD_409690 [Trifolium subterraneum]